MKTFIENKKPILICIGFLFLVSFCNSQIYNKMDSIFIVNNLEKAKELADSIMVARPDAAACFFKARVYAAIAKDRAARGIGSNLGWEAFLALEASVAKDRLYIDSALKINQYRILHELYGGLKHEGMVVYNAAAERGIKDTYANAFSLFKKAATVRRLIARLDKAVPETDTMHLLYLSLAAIYADKELDAIVYSKKIIDNNIVYLPFKDQYQPVFQWLVFYYKSRRDAVNFYKYLSLSDRLFPESVYFKLIEIDWLREQGNYRELLEKHRSIAPLVQQEPALRFAYYRDLFHWIWVVKTSGRDNGENDIYKKELVNGLESLSVNGVNQVAAPAALLLAKTYRNMAADQHKKTNQEAQRNLLLLSNRFLKQVINDPASRNSPAGKEAASLLKLNNATLRSK